MGNHGLTIIQHLEELRKRIIYCLFFLVITSVFSYSFVDRLLYLLAKPIGRLVFIQPVEAFVTYIKLSIFCGFFISFPFIIYHIRAFVNPGLTPKERHYVLTYLPFGVFVFFAGCIFSFFVVIPFGIKFLTKYGNQFLVPMISVGSYVSFVCIMVLLFGAIFELPLVISLLSRLGIVNRKALRRNRKYAILIIFIISAILTPPDVFSQLVMALPLMVLYELGILFAR